MDFKELEHKNFGWANAWNGNKPEELVRRDALREKLGYVLRSEKGMLPNTTRYYCKELNYEYLVDDGD